MAGVRTSVTHVTNEQVDQLAERVTGPVCVPATRAIRGRRRGSTSRSGTGLR